MNIHRLKVRSKAENLRRKPRRWRIDIKNVLGKMPGEG
jgi:hypothetical protein